VTDVLLLKLMRFAGLFVSLSVNCWTDRSTDWRMKRRRRNCLAVDQDSGKKWTIQMLSLRSSGCGWLVDRYLHQH